MNAYSTNRHLWLTMHADASYWAGYAAADDRSVFKRARLTTTRQNSRGHLGRVRRTRAVLAASAADVIDRAL